MDIEKLIERLRNEAATFRPNSFAQTMLLDAATALSALQIEKQALRNAANGFKAENAQLRRRLSEAVSACSRIQEWAQNTGHDYVEGIAREFLEGEEERTHAQIGVMPDLAKNIQQKKLHIEITRLRAELERVKRERDAAAEDLRVCSIENRMECQYCLYRTARSFCWDCTDGSNWQWRGPRKEN